MGDEEGEKKGEYTSGKSIQSNHVSKKSLKRIDCTVAGYYSKISENLSKLQCSHLNNFYTVIFRILPVVYITNTAKVERNIICVSARQNKIFAPASSLLQWLNELGFRHRH